MAISRVKTWIAGEVLTAADLNTEFNNPINNALSLISPLTGTLDCNDKALSNVLTLDLAGINQAPLAAYDFTDTSDTAIATVAQTGTLWSSSQSIVIPTNGMIMFWPTMRIDNASGGNRTYYIGLRIDGTDYFAQIDNNGTAVPVPFLTSVATAQYRTLNGFISGSSGGANMFDIVGSGISTGSQTVQPIIAAEDSTATQTLNGTTVTARMKVAVVAY